MQSLDIISVNLWQILISLVNLLLIYLILKKFLFKPVKKLMTQRQTELDQQYAHAAEARQAADANREAWETKLQSAHAEADEIITDATDTAKRRAGQIVEEANAKADGILRRAEAEAELERKKVTEGIKREIVEVSATIAEKMLEREVNEEDHRAMIDSFIEQIGEDHDGNQ